MNSIKGKVLIINRVQSSSHDTSFDFVLLLGQKLKFNIRIAVKNPQIFHFFQRTFKSTYLDLAAESLAGKFSHRLTVTTRAFLSKLYRIVQCKVPKIWLASAESKMWPDEDRLKVAISLT